MMHAAPDPPSSSDLDFLLSLSDLELSRWLKSLSAPMEQKVLESLIAHTRNARRPRSPAALGQVAWGARWMDSPHLQLLDRALEDLAARKFQRLMVMMPPRHGKSVLVSQFFPAWYLGTHPDHRVILAGYEAGFARAWGRKARDILLDHGRRSFGVSVRADTAAAHHWELAGRFGGMVTAGVGGPITGRGADLLIIDDPIKNAEQAMSETHREKVWQWWTSTAMTRLEPDGVAVLVQTRWHNDDLAGRIEQQQAEEPWHIIRLAAVAEARDPLGRKPGQPLWPQRFDAGRLAQVRAAMPAYWWQSLYQQQPSGHEGALWPSDYFCGDDLWFDRWPDDLPLRVMTLDPSKGKGTRWSDYSAYVMLGVQQGGLLWVEADMANDRPPAALVDEGIELALRFRPHAFRIESNAWQDLLAPMFAEAMRARGLFHPQPGEIRNHVKKELRIENLDCLLRARQIHFRRTKGTELLVEQLRNFPVGRHDDGPDALEMAVRTAQELWDGGEETVSFFRTIGDQAWKI